MTNGRSSRRILRIGACLSLTGQYARFGRQAARALRVWQSMCGTVDITVEDDESSSRTIETALPKLDSRCDVLLGPYSTQLMRTAGRIAAEEGWLLWNQGGSGDDVEVSYPGHVISVLTPTGRYAEPFLRQLVDFGRRGDLRIVHGKGSFGRQVAAGAEALARKLGLPSVRVVAADRLTAASVPPDWDLFSVGRFEDDVDLVRQVQAWEHPPVNVCAVAGGVREFGDLIERPRDVFGIAQWFPGDTRSPALGPNEASFLAAYSDAATAPPDYPAIQAVAGAILAEHCVREAGTTAQRDLWSIATALDTDTLFGAFKVDPTTGAQVKHQMALVRWSADGLRLYRGQR